MHRTARPCRQAAVRTRRVASGRRLQLRLQLQDEGPLRSMLLSLALKQVSEFLHLAILQ
jgi:hypothetical protein